MGLPKENSNRSLSTTHKTTKIFCRNKRMLDSGDNDDGGDDGRWGCPPSKFPWTYSAKETCYLLKGKVKVYPDGHNEFVEFGAGDLVEFPKGGFDFRSTNITQSISNLGATMLKHRLTPPPDEVYSLHRKLSGAFLACIKLGAIVPCRELLFQVYDQYQFGDDDDDVQSRISIS
ncbi:hypothetical protein IFM89_022253 [Coptis chinensis]|uniref:(S)-ureidoglycine aminohydrolase cupin domain-containing protein n=1 Tax=Coptis chinensis TaxID=261450 RepID=A0A835LME8_9MAGN|nr:hypothetical protein IFM89_022253 [Coptis chinensis]